MPPAYRSKALRLARALLCSCAAAALTPHTMRRAHKRLPAVTTTVIGKCPNLCTVYKNTEYSAAYEGRSPVTGTLTYDEVRHADYWGKRSLSRDEFTTFLAEATSVVNNTPLSFISEDQYDPVPLSPAMLLTLKSCPNPAPLEDYTERDILAYGKGRWRRIQYFAE
ncbi:hypothetical protein HAZT_HAZT008843 [Hyalella azteca]|uniref:Uncharacterized protein n=1 Tax=Hyalella azteca TaxID=294128 RepID=A0A6A0GV60_HYAAZ|nr:hypothetical protein HAZT_HAZT008843 [Hyalella azteca]